MGIFSSVQVDQSLSEGKRQIRQAENENNEAPDGVKNKTIEAAEQDQGTKGVREDDKKEPLPGDLPEDSTAAGKEHAGKTVEIVVNGPLGHVYTQALNLLLSKEDMAAGGGLEMAMSPDESAMFVHSGDHYEGSFSSDEIEDDSKAYVYVTDASRVDMDELNRALDDMDKYLEQNPTGSLVLGLENALSSTVAASRLMRMVELKSKKVYCSRSSTLNALKGIIKVKN